MSVEALREAIEEYLGFNIPDTPNQFTTFESIKVDGYRRLRISYTGEEGDEIPTFQRNVLPVITM